MRSILSILLAVLLSAPKMIRSLRFDIQMAAQSSPNVYFARRRKSIEIEDDEEIWLMRTNDFCVRKQGMITKKEICRIGNKKLCLQKQRKKTMSLPRMFLSVVGKSSPAAKCEGGATN